MPSTAVYFFGILLVYVARHGIPHLFRCHNVGEAHGALADAAKRVGNFGVGLLCKRIERSKRVDGLLAKEGLINVGGKLIRTCRGRDNYALRGFFLCVGKILLRRAYRYRAVSIGKIVVAVINALYSICRTLPEMVKASIL